MYSTPITLLEEATYYADTHDDIDCNSSANYDGESDE